jgi:hypothetical protein
MRFLCALGVLCCLCLPALALDREAFTFTKYNLDVRIEPEQQRLAVRGTVSLRNDSDDPQKNLSLQISSSLNWSSIQFEGKPLEFVSQTYTSDIDHTGALSEALVTLPKAIAPRQTIEFEIGYEGVISLDTTRLTRIGVPAEEAKHSDWDHIGATFTAVRGIGYVTWYPVAIEAANLSEPSSVSEAVGRWKQRESQAEMKVKFTHSASSGIRPVLFCDGKGSVLSHEDMGASHSEQTLCAFEALSLTVPIFAIGSFAVIERPAVNISYDPDHKSAAENYALAAEEVAPFVDAWLGDHRMYPESKAEVIELSDPQAAPFESGNLLLSPLRGNDTQLLLAAIQQLTHLHFSSPRSWIHDGLARYAQVRFVQEKEGRPAALKYLQSHDTDLVTTRTSASAEQTSSAANSLINSPDEFYVQTKAMSVWWMLRDIIGENSLTAALHNYRSADDRDASYMQKLVEAQAHRDIEWFFDDWVYRDRALPDFRIFSVYPRELVNGGYMVTVTVENLGGAAAEIPVTLHMEHSEASQRLVVPGKSRASIRIQAASLPREISVNDGGVPETNMNNNTFRTESVSH